MDSVKLLLLLLEEDPPNEEVVELDEESIVGGRDDEDDDDNVDDSSLVQCVKRCCSYECAIGPQVKGREGRQGQGKTFGTRVTWTPTSLLRVSFEITFIPKYAMSYQHEVSVSQRRHQ